MKEDEILKMIREISGSQNPHLVKYQEKDPEKIDAVQTFKANFYSRPGLVLLTGGGVAGSLALWYWLQSRKASSQGFGSWWDLFKSQSPAYIYWKSLWELRPSQWPIRQ